VNYTKLHQAVLLLVNSKAPQCAAPISHCGKEGQSICLKIVLALFLFDPYSLCYE
jgi:hypothetical protein